MTMVLPLNENGWEMVAVGTDAGWFSAAEVILSVEHRKVFNQGRR
jgi:hypothetical protein